MLDLDAGLKWRGWSLEGEYYFRWVDHFDVTGFIPVTSLFDQGFLSSRRYRVGLYGRCRHLVLKLAVKLSSRGLPHGRDCPFLKSSMSAYGT